MAEGPPSFLLPPECGLLLLLRLLLTLGQRCGELGVGGTKGSIKASPSPTATLAPRACTSSSGATHAAVGD